MAPNSSKSDDFIDPADFKTSVIHIHLINETTSSEIKDNKRIWGDKALKTEDLPERLWPKISEFGERHVSLETPKHTCASGHHVSINLSIEGPNTALTFSSSGKVKSVETLNKESDTITVDLLTFDDNQWKKFKNFFGERQYQILAFFSAVKG